ncbi:hypothetical protein BGZ83_004353, partial [Gryganskiella cystojenkinii]
DAGVTVASFESEWMTVKMEGGYTMNLNLASTPLTITPEETAGFINLLVSLTTKDKYTFKLQGKGDIQLTLPGAQTVAKALPFGGVNVPAMTILGIGISSDITMPGSNNFGGGVITGVPSTVSAIQKDPVSGKDFVTCEVSVRNPSAISFSLGLVTFHASDTAGVAIGIVVLEDLKLGEGENMIHTVLTADTGVDLNKYLSMVKTGLTLNIKATADASKNPIVV